ncbi:unnamed protein product [Mytilus edulis]|uniref:C-type lectin domain-containing protein n=1 Tax=Mytilus edulis TaxID=6550 RepID=A0A8S3SKH2_MYTED|nr:unnamed protein product [Mytilus edulis]
MGCAEKSKCQQYFGPENRKRNVDVNGACCTTDNCNNQLPLVILSQEIPPTPSPSNMSVNTTADPNACENLDDVACHRLKSSSNLICSKDGLSSNICPRMCGKCYPCVHNHRHCPTGYTTSSSTCVMIGQHKMTWYESKQFCASHCGRLVDFSSFHDMQHIFASLVPHNTRVWTDAHYVHHKWIWNHNGQSIDRSQFRHLSTTHTNNHGCGFAVVHTNKTTTEDLIPTDCTKDHLPLCEAIRT